LSVAASGMVVVLSAPGAAYPQTDELQASNVKNAHASRSIDGQPAIARPAEIGYRVEIRMDSN